MSVSHRIKNLWAKLADPRTLRVLFQGVALAPRLLLHVASIAALAGLFAACVPATRYEEAKSASEVQLAGRQRAEAELAATQHRLDAALSELGQRDRKLNESEQSVSESKLESTLLVKQRDEATGLVDQLRSELARVGDNLRTYAEQKAELEKSLQAAQARKLELEQNEARTVAVALLTRDLTAALGERVTRGDVRIDVSDGRVLLRAAPELWFNDDASVRSAMEDVLTALGRVLSLHPQSNVELGLTSTDAARRAAALISSLGAHRISAERVKLAKPKATGERDQANAEPRAQIELSISAG